MYSSRPLELSELLWKIARTNSKFTIKNVVSILSPDIVPHDILKSHSVDTETIRNLVAALPADFVYKEILGCTIDALKIVLKRRGLKISGRKAELVQRVIDSQGGVV